MAAGCSIGRLCLQPPARRVPQDQARRAAAGPSRRFIATGGVTPCNGPAAATVLARVRATWPKAHHDEAAPMSVGATAWRTANWANRSLASRSTTAWAAVRSANWTLRTRQPAAINLGASRCWGGGARYATCCGTWGGTGERSAIKAQKSSQVSRRRISHRARPCSAHEP